VALETHRPQTGAIGFARPPKTLIPAQEERGELSQQQQSRW